MVIHQKLVSNKTYIDPKPTYVVNYCGGDIVTTADPIREIMDHFGTGILIELKLIGSEAKALLGEPMIRSMWQVLADHKFVATVEMKP